MSRPRPCHRCGRPTRIELASGEPVCWRPCWHLLQLDRTTRSAVEALGPHPQTGDRALDATVRWVFNLDSPRERTAR